MILLIPGPVTTRPETRAAAAHDYAPWDLDFRTLVATLAERLRDIAGGQPGKHVALPLPGCGHFAIEAAIRTLVPAGDRLLLPMTGDYASRIARLARESGRAVHELEVAPNQPADPTAIEAALRNHPTIRYIATVYSETSTGIVHPVPAIAAIAHSLGRRLIVDAVSAFGALPLDLSAAPAIDLVAFTANKCLEGLPGAAFVVARTAALEAARGQAASWSLDFAELHDHYQRSPGSPRFTPPAGTLAALATALDFYQAEGGQPARLARYAANRDALCDGIRALGLAPILPRAVQGPIVVNVAAPDHPAWNLQRFVDLLKHRGFLISNFKNTLEPSFRVGCIGAIEPTDIRRATEAMGEALAELGIATRQAA